MLDLLFLHCDRCTVALQVYAFVSNVCTHTDDGSFWPILQFPTTPASPKASADHNDADQSEQG